MSDIEAWVAIVASLAIILTALGGAFAVLLKFLRRIDSLTSKELTKNGGDSVKDRSLRASEDASEAKDRIAEVTAVATDTNDKVSALDGKLTEHLIWSAEQVDLQAQQHARFTNDLAELRQQVIAHIDKN